MTTMRLVFSSCVNRNEGLQREAFTKMLEQSPDCLILDGNLIYMDEFFLDNKKYYAKQTTLGNFAWHMWSQYQRLLYVQAFQQLLNQVSWFHAVWSDHDFAWRNAVGAVDVQAEELPRRKDLIVPKEKRLIARALFLQFVERAQQKIFSMPELHVAQLLDETQVEGIQNSFTFPMGDWMINVVLLDSRWYRGEYGSGDASMLGQAQHEWLNQMLQGPENTVHVLISGQALHGLEHRSWKGYAKDYQLIQQASKQGFGENDPRRILFLHAGARKPLVHKEDGLCQILATALTSRKSPYFGFGQVDFGWDGIRIDLFHSKADTKQHFLMKYVDWQLRNY